MRSRSFLLISFLLAISGQIATLAQDQVVIRVDAAKRTGPIKPIYAFFGYDEPNYTYTKNGSKLIGELAALT